jgi:hypothetical protein
MAWQGAQLERDGREHAIERLDALYAAPLTLVDAAGTSSDRANVSVDNRSNC